jgi:glutathione S-transferase
MKLYDAKMAPNCRRVRVFLAEKGLEIECQPVAITKGEQFSPEFLAKNPLGKVPVLELDDGSCLAESTAICEYLEELHPDPVLVGKTPEERAETHMWDRRIELEFFDYVLGTFRHTSPYFHKRMRQVPDYAECCREAGWKRLQWLNEHLTNNEQLAGDRFTIADITLLCAVDFAAVIGEGYDADEFPSLTRWHQAALARPSAAA